MYIENERIMYSSQMRHEINVKNEVYKTVIGDVVAHLKPQKFTVSSDL